MSASITAWDERRDLIIPGDAEETIAFGAEHFFHCAERSIQQRGRFAVALSGGSTPKAIYQKIVSQYQNAIDWQNVWLFWSDERAVPPNHAESNFGMAMQHFEKLAIPPAQIFRMKAETAIERHADDYADCISRTLTPPFFDLVMLGIGADGHTASLFPKTAALQEQVKFAVANFVPELDSWRMTLTYPCINASKHVAIFALGESKQAIVPLALRAAIASPFPCSAIGTPERKALWVLDHAATRLLGKNFSE